MITLKKNTLDSMKTNRIIGWATVRKYCLLCDVRGGHVANLMGTRIGRHYQQGVTSDTQVLRAAKCDLLWVRPNSMFVLADDNCEMGG